MIALGVLGFCLANQKIVSSMSVRLLISLVFIAITFFSVLTLSAHLEREVELWVALEAHVAATPSEFIPEDAAYIDSLKPTSFTIKAGAIVAADMLVVLVVWFSPRIKEQSPNKRGNS